MENQFDSMEILNIKQVNKGALVAVCDIHLPSVKFKMLDVKIFEKNNSQWLGLYTKEFINANGQNKHKQLIAFDSEQDKLDFTNKVLFSVNKHIEKNGQFVASLDSLTPIDDDSPF